jgi:hypothetical protein
MHDCRETRARLLDLAFDEVDADQRLVLLGEIELCLGCRELYQSTMEALLVFDRVADAAMPDERFWAGYDGRLRDRLAQQVLSAAEPVQSVRVSSPLRISSWWFPLAAGVALLLLAFGAWAALSERRGAWSLEHPLVDDRRPAGNPSLDVLPGHPDGGSATTESPPGNPRTQRARLQAGARPGFRRRLSRPAPPRGDLVEPLPVVNLEAARHIERAEMLLRSFRNASLVGDAVLVDVEYEKQRSRELLDTNVLLRRSAETTKNVLVGEVLGDVEPFLLDIVNLPDRPSAQDVRSISDRLERTKILTELQLYSAEASNRTPSIRKY